VTRLGEFLPVSQLFIMGSLKITEEAKTYGLLFPLTKSVPFCTKMGFFERFFHQLIWGTLLPCPDQGCQIFLGPNIPKGGKYTK
jgi:hypothetical protein